MLLKCSVCGFKHIINSSLDKCPVCANTRLCGIPHAGANSERTEDADHKNKSDIEIIKNVLRSTYFKSFWLNEKGKNKLL